MRRVLLAYSARNETTGYCQGLNVIAATLVTALKEKFAPPTAEDEALAYWLLVVLTEIRCCGWWEASFASLRRDVYECCDRARSASRQTASPESSNLRRVGVTVERLVDDLSTPIDLIMTQWLLTVFSQTGAGSAPLGLRLRALDLALCAPSQLDHTTRGPGSTALLSLSFAAIAAVRIDEIADVVQAARSLELAICRSEREPLFLTAHALSRDAVLFSPSTSTSKSTPRGWGEASHVDRLSPSAFWLEAAARVTDNAVKPLENAVAESAPHLAPYLNAASERSLKAVTDAASSAPLALVTCTPESRSAALRFVRHVVGDPITISGVQKLPPLEPPPGRSAVVHAWGTRRHAADRAPRSEIERVCVVVRSPRPPLRRFSLAILVASAIPDRAGLDDDALLLCSIADFRFVVVDLGASALSRLADLPSTTEKANPTRVVYIFVAGRLALRGTGAVLKAVGTALFYVSRRNAHSNEIPDYFVVGPLDAETRGDLRGDAALVRDLARDERRLMRIFAALPRARAHSAIEKLLYRARLAQTTANAVQALANAHGQTWRKVSRWINAIPGRGGSDPSTRHALADLDVPELRALAAEGLLPIDAFRTAMRELDTRKWTRAYTEQLASALDSAVAIELPAMLRSAAALSSGADRAARSKSNISSIQ